VRAWLLVGVVVVLAPAAVEAQEGAAGLTAPPAPGREAPAEPRHPEPDVPEPVPPGPLPPPPESYGGGEEPEVEEPPEEERAPTPDGDGPAACWDPADHPDGHERPADVHPTRRCRRSTVEIIELYVGGGLYGLGTGAFVGELVGNAELGGILALLGGGLGSGAVFLLDGMGEGLPPGVPASISTGLLLGFWEGFFASSAYAEEPFAVGTGAYVWTLATAGALVGGLAGFALRPTVGDNALVRSGGFWGLMYAQMINVIGDEDDIGDTFKVLFTGYNAGIVGTAILTSLVDVSRIRTLYLDLGGVAGAIGGLVVASTLGAEEDPTAVGWSLALGTAGGMALSLLLSAPEDPEPTQPDVALYTAPIPGGAAAGASTRF